MGHPGKQHTSQTSVTIANTTMEEFLKLKSIAIATKFGIKDDKMWKNPDARKNNLLKKPNWKRQNWLQQFSLQIFSLLNGPELSERKPRLVVKARQRMRPVSLDRTYQRHPPQPLLASAQATRWRRERPSLNPQRRKAYRICSSIKMIRILKIIELE